MQIFMKRLTPYLNKIGLSWNLPYWIPLISRYNTGVAWYRWFFWFWTYTESSWFTNNISGKFYCFRLCGFQLQTIKGFRI